MSFQKNTRARSTKILQSCKGQTCKLRIVHCSGQDTVSGCHINFSGGKMGGKESDIFIADGCSNCHDVIDLRVISLGVETQDILQAKARGLQETQQRLLNEGYIKI